MIQYAKSREFACIDRFLCADKRIVEERGEDECKKAVARLNLKNAMLGGILGGTIKISLTDLERIMMREKQGHAKHEREI